MNAQTRVRNTGRRTFTLGLLAGLLLFAAWLSISRRLSGFEACEGRPHSIVVTTRRHTLWLCGAQGPVQGFPVALGRGGVDKRQAGDRRTPRGQYRLDPPRESDRFGIFIPVGYPTKEERRRGFSGSAIGLHGPDHRFRWLGPMNSWADWTQGCIAVATDAEIRKIADWARRHQAREIHIR